uniref:Uncharacterized protein n=1 Tax=Rhizophora mucronata TaxID=61149 RepID=A0A2P2PRY2_RHIMU
MQGAAGEVQRSLRMRKRDRQICFHQCFCHQKLFLMNFWSW